jgi:hypothetical protein
VANEQLVTQSDLQRWTGYNRQGDLEKCLRNMGVKFTKGKGNKLITTQGCIDAAIAGKSAANEVEFK